MNTILNGNINDFVSSFNAYLDDDNNLILADNGDFSMTVDTGFSGGIAINLEVIDEMGLKLVDFDTFRLATGEIVELPVFLGKIFINENGVETWFIPGDSLLGMEFLSSAGRFLSLNFENKTVKLEK